MSRAILPLAGALLASGLLLLVVGIDPVAYARVVVGRSVLSPRGLQETVTRTAPLLLLAAGLIVSFRAGIWNLGVDGQFVLAAVVTAAVAPMAAATMPYGAAWIVCLTVGAGVGAGWALLPALLRAFRGVNEIITTLMMNFLGASLANLLVKGAFGDPSTTVPITRTLPEADRLPLLFGTTVSVGVPFAVVVLLATHMVMTRTATGLRLHILGQNVRAARHAGLNVAVLTFGAMLASGALAGLAGSVVVVGTLGNVRADWNPAYGIATIPLVLLARLNGVVAIGFVLLFAMLSIGAEAAAVRLGVPGYVTLVLVGLLLLFLGKADSADAAWR